MSSRGVTLARRAVIGVTGLAAILALAAGSGVLILRSDWFREKVRERIVSEAAKATNGRVELGVFRFNWATLTAELDDFVIHGTEPAGAAPLFAVKRLVVGLKIISLMERTFNIQSVEGDSPRAHLIIQADGNTNIPPPNKFKPQMILDLKVGSYWLKDGAIVTESAGRAPSVTPWNGRGENLAAQAHYDIAKARYDGEISLDSIHFQFGTYGPIDARLKAEAALRKNQFIVSRARIETTSKNPSALELHDVLVNGFIDPVVTASYDATVALDEIDRVFHLVDFQHTGNIGVKGEARFVSPRDYLVSGSFQGSGIGYGKSRDLRASGSFEADPKAARLHDLRLAALGGEIVASGEVERFSTFSLAGELRHLDGAQIAFATDTPPLPYDGMLSGQFHATGTLSERNYHDLAVTATLSVAPAPAGLPVEGELRGRFDGTSQTLSLDPSWLATPASRVDFSGIPGQALNARLESKNLNELRPAIALPEQLTEGTLSFRGSVEGSLTDPRLAGHAAIRNGVLKDQRFDAAEGDFKASNAEVAVSGFSVALSGMEAQVNGSIRLNGWKIQNDSAINASVKVANGDVTKLLEFTGWKDKPLSGTLGVIAQVSGTVADPRATGDLSIAKGQIYGEPFDTAVGHARYARNGAETLTAVLNAGPRRLNLTGDLNKDHLKFTVSSNVMALNQLATVRKEEPDLVGMARITASGELEIKPHVVLLGLNGEITGTSLALGSRNFGDVLLTATTTSGVLSAHLISNAVKAVIRGDGTIRLGGDYPAEAKLTFSDLRLNAVEAMLNPSVGEHEELFEGTIAGQVTLNGPARTPDLITASAQLDQVEMRQAPTPGQSPSVQSLVLRNDGPVRMDLSKSVVRIESAHFIAPETSVRVGGSVTLNQKTGDLNIAVEGNVNLALAHTLNPDYAASGEMIVNAAVRGTLANPDFTGRAVLQNGEFHYADFVTGLTNAKGIVLFGGTQATIQSFSGESGGGKVDATGFVALRSPQPGGAKTRTLGFRLETHARGVRIRYPEGVSSLSDADLNVSGTSDRSEVSGKVTVRRIVINPTADAAGILASSATPSRTSAVRTGIATNMNLDVQIDTAPDVSFETSVAQSLEADATLRLRGTVTNPALLGRINVTQGQMVFFGNRYIIDQGSVTFLNPAKIDPVLNVSVETKARGVQVTLTISGPINKLNVSYRSDPPLQFGDIVALLATGRAPTNATLESAGTGALQNFKQLGATELLGQALANPSSGRIQRFFGVSNIKLDPELSGISGSPETRLSIEQQVTPNILFTYNSSVADASTQLIRVELDVSAQWAAILSREENGYVALDFAYRRRFK